MIINVNKDHNLIQFSALFQSGNLSLEMPLVSYQKLLKYAMMFLTINGLSPFIYDRNKSVVQTSKKLYIYSLIVTTFLNIFFIFGSIYYDYIYFSRGYDYVLFMIIILELFFGTVKAVVLLLLHIIYHIEIVELVNDALKIKKIVTKFAEPMTTCNHEMKKFIKIKFILVVLQMICLAFTMDIEHFFEWIILSYPLVLSMMATSIYIFGGMLMNLKSISIINEKLKLVEMNLRQNYHDFAVVAMSEDVEKVSVLLIKIQKFTTNLNKYYGVPMCLTFVGSTFLILASVRFIK